MMTISTPWVNARLGGAERRRRTPWPAPAKDGPHAGRNGTIGPVIDAIRGLLPPLLGALDRVGWVHRHLYPPRAGELAGALAPAAEVLTGPLRALEAAAGPEELGIVRGRLVDAARRTVELIHAFVDAARAPDDVVGLYRALRRLAPVQEGLYPLAPALEPVSRYFLEPARRDDDALVARLREATLRDDDARLRVTHASNERDARGGFSLYVPELWDGAAPLPLVVALHGGHGHGRDFLWSWLREARSRGMLVLAPTSRGRTWSLMGADVDADNLSAMLEDVAARYPVDHARVLLTGMSDGATYALLVGFRTGAPFTHLAPMCGVLHPLAFADGGFGRARGRPIYLVHGALDWMFPVQTARHAREVLSAAGADLVYREIDDLSHTYPRDENPAVLDWLASGRAVTRGPSRAIHESEPHRIGDNVDP
jgi:phospholipase/carboxylesterase